MTVTTDQQMGDISELKCSENLATSISSGDEQEMGDKVVTVGGTAECVKSTSEKGIDKVSIEGNEEGGGEEDAIPTEMEVEPSQEGNIDSGSKNLATGGDNGPSDDGVENESNDKEEGAPEKDTHQEQEAELEAFLESLKPKPKRKSIKEMIMAMPGYKDISTLKPKIGGDVKKNKKDVIILDDEVAPRRLSKRQQQIEELKDRFVKHALVAPPKPLKEEHVTLKIKKKEEDSQGIEHLVENEVEYIRNPLNEEDEAMGSITPGALGTSPQSEKPGAKYCSLRQNLLGQIRMKKLKLYEERVKLNAADNEEGDEDGASDKEEILDDSDEEDEEDDGDSDLGEEEEELEDLLSGPGPKKDKNAYIDDEAEDEDGDDEDDEDEDDTDLESNEKDKPDCGSKYKTTDTAELESIGDSRDSDLITPTVPDSQTNKQEEFTTVNQSENENSASMDFGIDLTPKVSATVLTPATPSDFWIPAKTSVNSRHADGLSPLIPRINRKTDFLEKEKETAVNAHASVPVSLANVISESETKFDDLVDLCSGKFVTQQQPEPSAIPDDDDEFGNFDFGDDDFCEDNKTGENSECVKTPVAGSTRNAVDGITPKLAAKPTIARRSMQFEMEAEVDKAGTSDKTSNSIINAVRINLDDEDDDGIVTRRSIKKNKRLQFSDDEGDDNDETTPSIPPSEDEQSDREEEDEVRMVVEPPKVDNPFFNKHGKLKRKFVEDEAELSGSDEGSGDEDERGLNDYEMEEGDDEKLDESEIKDQVGRVHMKITLDDDDRQIQYLQNKYVEDGDLGGEIREQKFRFFDKNGLTDDARMGDSDEEEQEETAEERLKRDEWIEKRKWISENSHLLENDADESQSLLTSIKIGKQTLKRIESFVDTSTSESKEFHFKETSTSIKRNSIWEKILETRKAATKTPASGSNSLTACSEGLNFGSVGNDANMSVDESSKSMTEPMFGGLAWTKNSTAVGTKGSFLSRGGAMLAKLAETTKPGDTVSYVKNNSRNFVFSHITPPNVEKTDGSTSRVKRATNKGSCKAQAKKIKVDRSFHSLDETSKQSSVFKFF